nr:cytidylate kinase-like family protein [uncultured Blautia sp.]
MSKRIITINRMYGSGGRAIGKALAEELEIGFYDKELIEIAARNKNIPFGDLADVDEKRPGAWSFPVNHEIQISQDYRAIPMNDVLFELQRDIILSLSDKEDCVIVGRCANHILQDRTLSVFIYAPFETRVKNVMERLDREEKSARKLVKRMDKERRSYYEFFTDEKWLDMGQYDLCIDSSKFTTEEIVRILKEAYER